MEERISRTAGNVYEKVDKDTWNIFSKEKKVTSFVDIMELTISDNEDDEDLDDIDMKDVIENIRALKL